MRIALYSIPMFLLLAAGAAQAQANRIPADRTPTAGVEESPALPSRSSTAPATDSVMAGGDAVPLPGGEWDMGGGKQPPPVPVPPPVPALAPDGAMDAACSADAYENMGRPAQAVYQFSLAPDGRWDAFPSEDSGSISSSCAPASSGMWLSALSPGAGANYEVSFVLDQSSGGERTGQTGSTGWMPLDQARGVGVFAEAQSGPGLGGRAANSVIYTVRVRKAGEPTYSESKLSIYVAASSDP